MPLQTNPGRLPDDCVILDEEGNVTGFHKVHVVTFRGFSTRAADHAPWPAGGGRPPTNWAISTPPHDSDIQFYEVI
ncbi:hypothetical protein [Novosphingobium sp.]|uniref:hypothetical protein n=1 Tax=Novosphingobium sp. TaxID=1874826 RepID=UPI002FDE6137